LYEPIQAELNNFTRKPVMLAEFGSLDINDNQEEWTREAMQSIKTDFPEISAIVMFNSAFDKNIPENNWYQGQFLDWTSKHLKYVGEEFPIEQNHEPSFAPSKRIYQPTPLEETNFKGINYKKAKRWQNTYYHLSKD